MKPSSDCARMFFREENLAELSSCPPEIPRFLASPRAKTCLSWKFRRLSSSLFQALSVFGRKRVEEHEISRANFRCIGPLRTKSPRTCRVRAIFARKRGRIRSGPERGKHCDPRRPIRWEWTAGSARGRMGMQGHASANPRHLRQ